MTRKEKKIKQIQVELKRFKDKLAEYQIQFNADGYVDPREQAQLDRMNNKIDKIDAKLTKAGGAPITSPNPKVAEQNPNPPKPNPKPIDEHKDSYVYKDVTTQQYNKITELYKTGKIGSVDEKSDVHWNDVSQGGVGDCYFMSAIGAVAKSDPSLLKKLIKGPFKDGSYEVTLHIKDNKFFNFMEKRTAQKVVVTAEFLVDSSGRPLYTGSGDAELWVMLLEKAFALLRGRERTDKKRKMGDGYNILTGGWGEEGMEVLTGKEASTLWIKKMSDEKIKATITDALADKRPITTGTIPGPAEGKKATKEQVAAQKLNIVLQHEYFVLSFDGSNITLQNPWNAETVDGDGRGDITISFADYRTYYRNICVQDK
jgi:hypothetical protein